MRSASSRRSLRELSRYKLRTFLTVLTLAVAVTGIWLFATPQQLGGAMDVLVAEDRLHDVVLYPDGVALDDAAVATFVVCPTSPPWTPGPRSSPKSIPAIESRTFGSSVSPTSQTNA